VDDRVDPPQRMAEREVVAQVAECDLDLDTFWPQPARIAHQAAHGRVERD
jgi:hypothetical protein